MSTETADILRVLTVALGVVMILLTLSVVLGCDFVVLGAVKPTATHPGQPGIGWDAFARLRECTSLPIYAIGGLGGGDLDDARRHGAQGVAGIRSFWRAV